MDQSVVARVDEVHIPVAKSRGWWLVLRSGSSFLRAFVYLALYNFLFILPLIIILWLTWRGLQTAELLAWSRRNVAFSKCLLGFFFLGLAALLLIL